MCKLYLGFTSDSVSSLCSWSEGKMGQERREGEGTGEEKRGEGTDGRQEGAIGEEGRGPKLG